MNSTKTFESSLPDYCKVVRITTSNGEVKELVFPKALDLDRPKRPRTTFTGKQLDELEREFRKTSYLVGTERSKLASRLELSETQIKVWFQNRRTKLKRKSKNADSPGFSPCDSLNISSPSKFPYNIPYSPFFAYDNVVFR